MEPEQNPNDPLNQPNGGQPPLPSPGQSVAPTSYQPTAAPQAYEPSQETDPIAAPQVDPQFPQQMPASRLMPSMPTADPIPTITPTPKKKGKLLLVLLIVVLILAIGAVVALLLLNKKKPQSSASTGSGVVTHSYASSENAALSVLQHDGSSLSASSLASINSTDLFYATFRNAAEQPIVTTTTNRYWTAELNSDTALSADGVTISDVNQAGYDYKSGQFSYQSSGSGNVDKCVNGVDYYTATDISIPWTKSPNGNDDCQVANTTATINDGLNTGGLSTAQAQQFVDTLRDIKGLITVSGASLITTQGQHYIQFNVSVDANTDCYPKSVPSGVGCFEYAFEALKLPKSWPYNPEATLVSGAQFAYFVDPTTQLPAYTQMAYTPVSATQGNWQDQQIEYAFGPLPTFQVVNGTIDAVSMSWPVIQL